MGCKSHGITHSTHRYELAKMLDAIIQQIVEKANVHSNTSTLIVALDEDCLKLKLIHLLSNHSLLPLVKYSP